MNRVMKVSATLFLLLTAFCITNAQVGIKSVGVNGGLYFPSMDYWKNNALAAWDESFGGGPFANLNVEINIVNPVSTRVGIGYWSQSLTQTDIPWGTSTRTDKITVQFLPISFDVLARIPIHSIEPLGIYGGIGLGINLVSMEYTRTTPLGVMTDKPTGRDYITYLLAGVDYRFNRNFAVGTEFKYIFGKYVQEMGIPVVSNDVSIDGPAALITFKYILE